ncbi:MAG: glycerate kinase [Actinobacteria bacterium]|nr:glycerate kinase [Actinomycetota bacterium]
MRVLIAPDDFAGTLSAAEAAEAIAAGWRWSAPGDILTLLPLSDGGPGFVQVIAVATDAEMVPVGVRGPMGETAIGVIAVVERTAYVESAHGCGLALVHPERRDAGAATSYGVGQLIAAAIDSGARTIVVGLGGTASTDGGAGMLAALGATATDADGATVALDAGGACLADIAAVDLGPALERVKDVELIAATDVDAPLIGPHGAARGFAPQKGADPEAVEHLEQSLTAFGRACAPGDATRSELPGAGAAGGLGFAFILLGARRVAGFDVVREAVGLDDAIAGSDLVVTGEGSVDWQSLRGKAVTGLAAAALDQGCPLVVIAGRVEVGRREYGALGITEAYAIGEEPGSNPSAVLARAAARVADQWSR